jgi:hypothetical protein
MLRDPLPSIPIPHRHDDAEPVIDLQSVLHEMYEDAFFEMSICKYEPTPPLEA